MNRILLSAVITLIIISGCSQQQSEVKVLGPVKELQKKYAPDKRIAVFAVKTYEQGNSLIVAGEVEKEEAKAELMAALAVDYKNIVDSVVVLPEKSLGDKTWGIITVSVANMRAHPGEDAELGSQVLMGSIVRILKKKGGWAYIQSPDKYLGWADLDQMIRVNEAQAQQWNGSPKIFVTDYYGFVQQQPSVQSFPVCDVTAGAVFKNLGANGEWLNVGLADGRSGFIKKSAAMDYSAWGTKITPAADNIERTGKFLLGVPYLWGGTSTKGVDCSGFTRTVFLLNGQLLNRDANQQAEQGEHIEPGKDFENLKKGDLLFYGRKEEDGKKEKIVHVGIYLGNKEYIHSSGKVRINSFDSSSPVFDEYNLKRFVRARRVIASTPQMAEVEIR